MKRIVLFVILITLAIVAAVVLEISRRSNTNQNGWQIFVSKELNFSVNHPKNWSPHRQTGNVSFEAEKDKGDPFAPYVRVTKNLSGPDIDAVGTFNKIYEASNGSKIENTTISPIADVNLTKVENLQIDGAKAAKILEESKMPGPFYAQRIYVLKDDIVWVISNVAPTKEQLDASQLTFDKAISSFKFLR